MRTTIGFVTVLSLAAACSNKLEGDLTLDGKTLAFDACRSGQVYGYVGVELVAKTGERIRLVVNPDNTATTLVSRGEAQFANLGSCGPMSLSRQNSTINDITNVEGKATLDCTADGMTLEGKVTWENCH